jgi:hypothetical protein
VQPGVDVGALLLRGFAAGFMVAGIRALAGLLAPDTLPNWPHYLLENAWSPALEAVVGPITATLLTFAATIVVLYWLDRFTAGWHRRRLLVFVVLAATEAAFSAAQADDWTSVVATGVFGGALTTFLFATILRFDLRIVPGFVAAQSVVRATASAIEKGTPDAYLLAALQVGSVLLFTWAVTRYLTQASVETPVPAPARPVETPAA